MKKNKQGFKIQLHSQFEDEKRNLIITDRTYKQCGKESQEWYKYTCKRCGWEEGLISSHNLLRGRGCSCCSGKTVVKDINSIYARAKWMLDLGVSFEDATSHTSNSNKKIKVTCNDCGTVKLIIINNLFKRKTISCICRDKTSYISKFVTSIFHQLNINFEVEKTFDWCIYFNYYKNKRSFGMYDFVIEDLKLIIETDGSFHRNDNKMNGQTLEESIFIDSEKDRLAKENGYKIIRISDEGVIKENILNSELSSLFDLSNIDWNKCEEFAISNRVKDICEFYRNNSNLSTFDLAKIFNLNAATINRYLKFGTNLSWCNYNVEEILNKICSKNGKSLGKKIKVFKDGKHLRTFYSISELSRLSVELFGVRLHSKYITDVCSGKKTNYKGFTFKYMDDSKKEGFVNE